MIPIFWGGDATSSWDRAEIEWQLHFRTLITASIAFQLIRVHCHLTAHNPPSFSPAYTPTRYIAVAGSFTFFTVADGAPPHIAFQRDLLASGYIPAWLWD